MSGVFSKPPHLRKYPGKAVIVCMFFKKIGCFCAIGLVAIGLSSCKTEDEKPEITTLKVQLSTESLDIVLGESESISAEVIVGESAVSDAVLQWSSTDPAVAAIHDGTVTAVSTGTATVSVHAEYGGKEASDSITVTVSKPTVSIEPETPVILDLSKEDGGLIAFSLPLDATDIHNVMVGDTEYRVVPQGEQMLIQATFLEAGEYIMTVEQEKQFVSFPIYVATTVIHSAKELQKAAAMSEADKGYFVLANNIDCTELTEPICFTDKAVFETNLGQNRAGFLGGFNGMGYTISNLKVPENGLFGCLAGSGVIRNVAFTDMQAEEYALCIYSAGLISQVYVQGDFSRVLAASFGPANQLKNIVAESTRSDALLCQHIASVDTAGYSVSEVYGLIMVGSGAQISKYSRTKQFNSLINDDSLRVYSGATIESIPSVTAEYGFNSYWDISSGYPIFISSVQ